MAEMSTVVQFSSKDIKDILVEKAKKIRGDRAVGESIMTDFSVAKTDKEDEVTAYVRFGAKSVSVNGE